MRQTLKKLNPARTLPANRQFFAKRMRKAYCFCHSPSTTVFYATGLIS